MRNKRKSISLLGWIIGALLLIYLGVFCYLNLCKYAQHVDSDIAAEALLAREIWVEKDITPNDWISSTERRIIGMPTVAAVFYGITGSMQTAAGITCVLLGAILLGTFYFFLNFYRQKTMQYQIQRFPAQYKLHILQSSDRLLHLP